MNPFGSEFDLDYACILINVSDVKFDCNSTNTIGTSGPIPDGTAAIAVTPNSHNVEIHNCPNITGDFDYGVYALGMENLTVDNVTTYDVGRGFFSSRERSSGTSNSCLNQTFINSEAILSGYGMGAYEPGAGFHIQGCQGSQIIDSKAYGGEDSSRVAYGVILEEPDDYTISNVTLYSNIKDLHMDSGDVTGLGRMEGVNITDLNLLPDSGAKTDYTQLDISEDHAPGVAAKYSVSWTMSPVYLNPWLKSFENKKVEIEYGPFVTGGSTTHAIDSVTWHYTQAEVDGEPYNESLLDVYNFTASSLGLLSTDGDAALNTGANTLTLTNLQPSEWFGVIEEPIVITDCQNITASGRYVLNSSLIGVQSGSGICLDIQADGVVIYFDDYEMSSGTGTGIDITGQTDVKLAGATFGPSARTKIFGYDIGVAVDSADDVDIDPIYFCDNTIGVLVNNSNNVNLTDVVACNNTQYGIYIVDSDNVMINTSRTYNNGMDLRVENNLGSPVDLDIISLIFDRPAGDYTRMTDLALSDSVAAGDAFTINWTANTATLPDGFTRFENKFVDISGDGPLDTVTLTWTDAESSLGYDEANLQLYEWDGANWTLLDGTADAGNNLLSVSSLNPASDYGILHNGSRSGTIDLYGANVTNVTHHGRYNGTSAGNISTEGGNVSGINISSTQLTERWAAFYGDVVGNIFLNDLSGTNVYSWSWAPGAGGVVCLSTNSSFANPTTVIGALGADIDTAWNLTSSATDSGNRTFNSTNCSIGIGTATVHNASYVDTGSAGGFATCALKSEVAPTKPQMLFCTSIISGGTLWNGAAGDYEVMVPTPEASGTNETYYFYANLN